MRITAYVEGAMKGELHVAGVVAERGGESDVHIAVRRERTNDGARGAELAGMPQVGAHHGPIVVAANETAASRADHRKNGNPKPIERELERSVRRRGACVGQVGAKFYAVGAAVLGVDCRLQRVNANFKQHGTGRERQVLTAPRQA